MKVLARKKWEASSSLKDNGSPYDCQLEKNHMTQSIKRLFLWEGVFFVRSRAHRLDVSSQNNDWRLTYTLTKPFTSTRLSVHSASLLLPLLLLWSCSTMPYPHFRVKESPYGVKGE